MSSAAGDHWNPPRVRENESMQQLKHRLWFAGYNLQPLDSVRRRSVREKLPKTIVGRRHRLLASPESPIRDIFGSDFCSTAFFVPYPTEHPHLADTLILCFCCTFAYTLRRREAFEDGGKFVCRRPLPRAKLTCRSGTINQGPFVLASSRLLSNHQSKWTCKFVQRIATSSHRDYVNCSF